MNAPDRDPARQTGRPGREHTLAAGIGVAAAMILCCAGPVLIATGALGAIAGFFSNPLVLLAAAALLLTGIAAVIRQRRRQRTEDCCPPAFPDHPQADSGTAPPAAPAPLPGKDPQTP
ncbi:hypothetical protein [Arthrobacter sp. M4]|uniref:hypothetical protein n=1 Tax=Arthrobacter sp. M4 TaxID=218160 RepID=UPI001CDC9C7E|nr:hypothetical protein [Arthrobacter sp. M4]MCA4135458.1 hypothetical protein [Arthrobacter sp. M4]